MRRSEFRSSIDMRMRRSGVAQLEFCVAQFKTTISFRDIFFLQILAKLALIIVSRQQNRHYFIYIISTRRSGKRFLYKLG